MRDNPLVMSLVAALGISGAMIVGGRATNIGTENTTGVTRDLPVTAGASGAPQSCGNDPVIGVLCDHFGVKNATTAEARFRARRSHVMIASLPDPLDSEMGFAFDQFVETIRLAAIAAGYQPDRFYLPWKPARDDGRREPLADYSFVVKTPAQKVDVKTEPAVRRPKHQRHPGALLFRSKTDATRPADPPSLLLVLLLGETPIFGADPRTTKAGFRVAHSLLAPDGDTSPAQAVLPVVGPVFSGAVEPLRREALRFLKRTPAVRVTFLTGTVTSEPSLMRLSICDRANVRDTSCLMPKDGTIPAGTKRPAADAEVSSFIDSAAKGITLLVDHLASQAQLDPGGKLGDLGRWLSPRVTVALLHEADTPYGHEFVSPEVAKHINLVALPYPLHVSQLWAARLREGRGARDPVSDLDPRARRALSLLPEAPKGPIDVPPVFHPATAANTADRVLANLLARVGQIDPEYVGLLGTNVHDTIFLAHMVKEHLPDAQLFVIGNEVLLTHPQHLRDLHGLRMLSSNFLQERSILEDSKDTTRPPPQEWLQLPASNQVSFYRATLQAVCSIDSSHDKARCDGLDLPRWIARDRTWNSDAMWLNAVGRGLIWPLELSGQRIAFKIRPPSNTLPGSFMLIMALYLAFAGFVCSKYQAAVRSEKPVYGVLRTVTWIGDAHRQGKRLGVFGLAFFMALLAGGGHAFWVWTPRWSQSFWLERIFMIAGGLVLIAGGATLLQAFRREFPSVTWRFKAARFMLLLVLLTAASFAGARFWPAQDQVQSIRDRILAQRALHLSSGLSPIVPWALLATGLGVLSYARIRRHRLLYQGDAINHVTGFAGSATDISELAEAVREALAGHEATRAAGDRVPANPATSPRRLAPIALSLPLALACAAITLVLFWRSRVVTLDGVAFGFLLSAGFAALLGGAAYLAWDALSLWRRLRCLLRALAWGPLGQAFDRLPEDFARTLGLRWSSEPPAASELLYDIDQGSLLRGAMGKLPGMATFENWPSERRIMDEDLAAICREHRWVFAHETKTQGILSKAAGEVLDELRLCWTSGRAVPDGKPDPRDGKAQDVLTIQRRRATGVVRLAEEFVAVASCRFISYTFAHVKNSLAGAIAIVVLTLLAAASYPFRPQHLLMNWILIEFVIIIGIAVALIVQTDRNEVLSRVCNRSANRLDLDATFLGQMFTYVLLPVAALLVTQFPALSDPLSRLFGAFGPG